MHDIKQLYERLEVAADDLERIHIYFDIATVLLNRDEKRALEYADTIKGLAEKIDSDLGRSYYHATKGRVLYRKSRYAEAEVEFQKALDLSLLTTDLLMQAISYDSMGVVYVPQHKHELALESAFKALGVYEQMNTEAAGWQKVVCYNNIGVAYKNMHELEKAEQYFLKGLVLAEDEPDERMKCNLLTNLSEIRVLQGNYAEGMKGSTQAIEGFKRLNHKVGEVHAMVYLAHCQLGLGEFALALQGYLAALKKLKEVDNKTMEIQALRGLGNVYMEMDAAAEATKHYQKALAIAQSTDEKETCKTWLALAQAYISTHNRPAAEDALNQGIALAQARNFEHVLAALLTEKAALATHPVEQKLA
jgi:tetratricopeptide (TPR) repeat protein